MWNDNQVHHVKSLIKKFPLLNFYQYQPLIKVSIQTSLIKVWK